MPFKLVFLFVLLSCFFVLMCAFETGILVDIKNMTNDNIRLCETCEHVKAGRTLKDWLFLNDEYPELSLEIWRQNQRLERFSVTAVTLPPEDAKRGYNVTIVITADIQDPDDPLDDIFAATPSNNYIKVAKY